MMRLLLLVAAGVGVVGCGNPTIGEDDAIAYYGKPGTGLIGDDRVSICFIYQKYTNCTPLPSEDAPGEWK